MYRRNQKIVNIICVSVSLLLALVLGLLIYSNEMNDKKRSAELEEQAAEERRVTDENSINLVDTIGVDTLDYSGAVVLVSYDEFCESVRRYSYATGSGVLLSYDYEGTSDPDGVYLLSFKVRASESSAQLKLRYGDKSQIIYVTTEWTEICVPIESDEIDFYWTLQGDFQIVQFTDVTVYDYSATSQTKESLPCGYYLVNEGGYSELLNESNSDIGKTNDIITDGNYLYSVGNNQFTISSLENKTNPQVVSTLEGISNGRRLCWISDNILAVASRQNGVYIIDVSDKKNPVILTRYNSLDTANDVCCVGNVLVIANRYYGVEFVDVSNPESPQYIDKIYNGKECYRVTVSGDYLYVSCWATRDVEVYDVSDISNTKKVEVISVDGRCGEAFVDGDNLYIVTGFATGSNDSIVGDFGFGTGNGLTIYDISDPTNAEWVSTVKCDGSLNNVGMDDWCVVVSDGIAYFTSSGDGVYIYDVSDPACPTRLVHVKVPYYAASSDNYSELSGTYVVPYDESEYVCATVSCVAIADGYVYFNEGSTSVTAFRYEDAIAIDYSSSFSMEIQWSGQDDSNRNDYYDTYLSNYDVCAVTGNGDDALYVGTSDGILVLSEDGRIIYEFQTDEAVKDIQYNNGYLYTAEVDKVSIYSVNDAEISFVSSYDDFWADACISSIAVTEDGNFVVIQAYWSRVIAINVSVKDNPTFVQTIYSSTDEVEDSYSLTPGSMYGRNIAYNSETGLIGVYGNSQIMWLQSTGDRLKVVRAYTNSVYGELTGITLLEDGKALAISSGGVKIFDPLTVESSELKEQSALKIENVSLSGKVVSYGDNIIVTNLTDGSISVVKISDNEQIQLVKSISTEYNPGLAYCTDNYIFVPARNGGLLRIAW